MVNVLIIEDSDDKRKEIGDEVVSFFGLETSIEEAKTFSEVARKIFNTEFDLIVTDLLLPRRTGDVPTDFSEDLIDYVSTSDINARSVVVAVSRFKDIVRERVAQFASRGIFLLPYDNSGSWRESIRICMQRVQQKMSYQFVILCALDKERSAFRHVEEVTFGEFSSHHGLDCVELLIAGHQGVCVVQPRMGLVDAAAVATRAITVFSPKIIAMAGICAGFKNEVSLGTLAVSDISWDHQAGKWKENEFEISSYQESMDAETRSVIVKLINEDPRLSSYRYNLRGVCLRCNNG
jgi:adenosylhomocysteine nucleosidase